eukprot:CAMPEP_0180212864 /NCGR_PEP_ID=MMETSP0987-20121128/13775_1 /TAXON_ID=697907 /ORGANISM="non described non described, Strain CCMP2293" /LENGTH=160 /DNA_ID=CAMNT_0022170655 /DNA_START=370 /DNA_END=852 /DNA_ORIENTATION=+
MRGRWRRSFQSWALAPSDVLQLLLHAASARSRGLLAIRRRLFARSCRASAHAVVFYGEEHDLQEDEGDGVRALCALGQHGRLHEEWDNLAFREVVRQEPAGDKGGLEEDEEVEGGVRAEHRGQLLHRALPPVHQPLFRALHSLAGQNRNLASICDLKLES